MAEYVSSGTEKVIKVIPKTKYTELRVTEIREGDVVEAIDIRLWYCTQKEPEMKPNYKGIRLKPSELAEILPLLQSYV